MNCKGSMHVFEEPDGMGSAPWCKCRMKANPAFDPLSNKVAWRAYCAVCGRVVFRWHRRHK